MGAVTGAGLNVVNWIFTGLAIVVVGARMFTRIVVVKQIGIDDALMFIALVRNPYLKACANTYDSSYARS